MTNGIGFVVNVSRNTSQARGLLDFVDLNGDRFPDIVSGGRIQYSDMLGGIGSRTGSLPGSNVRESESEAYSIAPGGTVPKSIADAKASFNNRTPPARSNSMNSNFGFTGSLGSRRNKAMEDLRDVNGDGLPDRVSQEGGQVSVELNLGYGFTGVKEPWGAADIDKSRSMYLNAGGTVSFNDGVKGFAGSLSMTHTLGYTESTLTDVNGDGLPDRVYEGSGGRLWVAFNSGGKFLGAVPWSSLSASPGKNQAFSMNGGVSFNITIGPLCIAACYVDLNPAVSLSTNIGRPEAAFQDVNGDGFADYVESTDDGEMKVAVSLIGKTNLLRQVRRPLGGKIDIDYKRVGNTYEYPQSKFVMREVKVFDGVTADSATHANLSSDFQYFTYAYEGARQDRYERDFLGFKTVTTRQHDTSGLNADTVHESPAYRRTVQTYGNEHFYNKGLLLTETLYGAGTDRWTETVNAYEFWQIGDDVNATVNPGDLDRFTNLSHMTLFPRLKRTEKNFYEGTDTARQVSYTEHRYDQYGNVTEFTDGGDLNDPADNVTAAITYTGAAGGRHAACADRHLVGLADGITVTTAGNVVRRRTADFDCNNGDLKAVHQHLEDGRAATTELDYDTYGNRFRNLSSSATNGGCRRSPSTHGAATFRVFSGTRGSLPICRIHVPPRKHLSFCWPL
jgi:hypothetical protein